MQVPQVAGKRPVCRGCGKYPHEIFEYSDMADGLRISADQYVEMYEETFDLHYRNFLCTPCWLNAGGPMRTSEGIQHVTAPLRR